MLKKCTDKYGNVELVNETKYWTKSISFGQFGWAGTAIPTEENKISTPDTKLFGRFKNSKEIAFNWLMGDNNAFNKNSKEETQ